MSSDNLVQYYSVDSEHRIDLRERGSKFMAYLFPVWADDTFDLRLSQLRHEYYDATHHCSAIIMHGNPNIEQAHDDGEPSGTAGLPILNAMRSANLVNAGLIVIRYFGGTKLGKSGLIETYGESARLCIESAKLLPVEEAVTVKVMSSYDNLKTVDLLLSKVDHRRLSSDYLEKVTLTLQVKTGNLEQIIELLEHVTYTGIRYERGEPGLVFAGIDR